jgi:hypothetical protein
MTTTPIPTGPNPSGAAGPSKLLIALIAVGGVLLLSVVALVFLLIGQNSNGGGVNAGDQTPLPTVTDTPAPTPTAEGDGSGDGGDGEQPVDNSVRFTSFNYDAQVSCDPTGNDEKPSPSISWSSANAAHVYWTPNSNDANASNGYEVGASGNQDDMSASKGEGERYEFPCNHRQYFDTTITLVGANGETVSKHVTFEDINWGSGGDDEDD